MTTSRLIISLDFELMWGMRDHFSIADYGDAVLGGRQAIPMMLERFAANGIAATWATVGLLFARNRREMLDYAPTQRPSYSNAALSPYAHIETAIGEDEGEDPYHYGASLLDRIAATPGQEIACHTYSHYFCLEDGQTLDQFAADLDAAKAIAGSRGHGLRSLVFARNQWTPAHVAVARDKGMAVFRGNPGTYFYKARPTSGNTPAVRIGRLIDGIVPIAGRLDHGEPQWADGACDVTASRFLRPHMARAPLYSTLHIDKICREMRRAARDGRSYHLWWHPHNFGRNTARNLAQLDRIIAVYRNLQDRYGMRSVTMAAAAGLGLAQEQTGK